MASLKEIKGRIASVKSTLKITSAMKMVASSKLRKAQGAIAGMLPYQKALEDILGNLLTEGSADPRFFAPVQEEGPLKVAVVCFSSNSSLCGAFNSNVIRKTLALLGSLKAAGCEVTVYPIGKKMADAVMKAGYAPAGDFTALSGKPSYGPAAAIAEELVQGYLKGRFDKVELVYNHFKSTASQPTVQETFLPMEKPSAQVQDRDLIIEPSRREQVALLLPKVLKLKVYTVLLDSAAAEHAARTVAMQIATDNADSLLSELNLEYNKGRQQKITNEILDLVGGSIE
ncbi:MAG: ATP synthase F1 subunit gamma [Bacteroidales bacterium]|nr:ATP synthase F1 subunit gamma [Bacteroidales bacterium]